MHYIYIACNQSRLNFSNFLRVCEPGDTTSLQCLFNFGLIERADEALLLIWAEAAPALTRPDVPHTGAPYQLN